MLMHFHNLMFEAYKGLSQCPLSEMYGWDGMVRPTAVFFLFGNSHGSPHGSL